MRVLVPIFLLHYAIFTKVGIICCIDLISPVHLYSRPSVIWSSFICNRIENGCSIRVLRVQVCVLLEYFKGNLYINVWASIIWIIHLSKQFYDFLRTRVQITEGLLYYHCFCSTDTYFIFFNWPFLIHK